MPTSAERAPLLLDTSVAVALVLEDHEHHGLVHASLTGEQLGLAGHAAFETFAVLTRLPTPMRLSAAAAARVLSHDFPHTVHLGAAAARALLGSLSSLRIAGGSVYDALVGAAAREHGLELVSLDRRALGTYAALGTRARLL